MQKQTQEDMTGKISIKDMFKVEVIHNSDTKEWLLKKHYAKRIPVILYAYGLFDTQNILIGVCTFGNAPSSFWNNGGTLFDNKHEIKTVELNRLILNDHNEKNLTSFFVSQCIKLLPKEIVIISYADMNNNHCGYIYQATNFIYTGIAESGYKQEWELNGIKRHGRWMCDIKKILGEKYNPDISFHKNIINNGGKNKNNELNKLDKKEQAIPQYSRHKLSFKQDYWLTKTSINKGTKRNSGYFKEMD